MDMAVSLVLQLALMQLTSNYTAAPNEETTFSLGRDIIELDYVNYVVSEKKDRAKTIFFANCLEG